MAATVTVTGVIGPGVTVSAVVFSNVSQFAFDCNGKEILHLEFSDGRAPVDISIAAQTTITVTVSGSAYTVSVS
jgi:hypothetical protein